MKNIIKKLRSWFYGHTTAEERNCMGCIVSLLLGIVFGVFGVGVMVVRELLQSREGNFELEEDDLTRYVYWGLFGCLINTGIVFALIEIYTSI